MEPLYTVTPPLLRFNFVGNLLVTTLKGGTKIPTNKELEMAVMTNNRTMQSTGIRDNDHL